MPTADRAQLLQAKSLYAAFVGRRAGRVMRVKYRRTAPPVVADLGELVGLIYRSDKWQPGRPRNYIHFMTSRPRLVSDPAGRQLYIVGGSYRVTARGLEG